MHRLFDNIKHIKKINCGVLLDSCFFFDTFKKNNYKKLVRYCLFGLMTMCAINIVSNMMQINLMNDYFVENIYSEASFDILAERNDSRVSIVGALFAVFIFSSFFLVGRWLYVSAKINYLLEREHLKITPGWSVGWYFVPFANLVMPYRSLKETFKASFDRDDWQNQKTTIDFPFWWARFLIGNGFSNVSFRMVMAAGETYEYTILNTISYIDITSDILQIINAVFLLRIINAVFTNHKKVNFDLTVNKP